MAAASTDDEWRAVFDGSSRKFSDQRPYARNWACELMHSVSIRKYGSLNIVTSEPGASCMFILTARHGLFVVRSSCSAFPTDDDTAYLEIVTPLINGVTLLIGSVCKVIHVCWAQVAFDSRYADSFAWSPDIGLALNEAKTVEDALDLLAWAGSLGSKMHDLVEKYYSRMGLQRCPALSFGKSPFVFRPDYYWDGSEVSIQPLDEFVRHLASISAN